MMLGGQLPSGQAKADFSVFVATLHLRTPAMINAVAAGQAEMLDFQLEMLLSSEESFRVAARRYEKDTGKSLGQYQDLKSFVGDKAKYNLAITQKAGLSIIAAADKIAPILYRRNWTLCYALEGFFVTSDHPVYRWVPERTHHPFYGDGGFLNRQAEITLPLSPAVSLLISDYPDRVAYFDGHGVDVANDMRAFAANRFVYSPRKDEKVAQMATQHKDAKHQFGLIRPDEERPNVKVVRRHSDRDGGV